MHESNVAAQPVSPAYAALERATLEARRADVLRALQQWLLLIAALGLLSVVAGMVELTVMVALASVFIAAQAADRDPTFERMRLILSAIFVIGASVSFGGLAVFLANNVPPGQTRALGFGIAAGAGVNCLVTSLRVVADTLSLMFFRTQETSHTLRLGARIVLMILLFAYPGWLAAPLLLEQVETMRQPLLDMRQMLSSVIGMVVLAFAAVGLWVRRDVPATLRRLGLGPLRPVHALWVVLGIGFLYALNTGSEALQREWFPEQWEHDQRMNQLLAGGITLAGALLLGVSAGVGEELAMRGALQPRLGLTLTSICFAALHVHYSWFGMATIAVLGAVLGLIRLRTNTTVAILVHSLYDIVAVFAAVGVPRP
jgi:hypothetical protein